MPEHRTTGTDREEPFPFFRSSSHSIPLVAISASWGFPMIINTYTPAYRPTYTRRGPNTRGHTAAHTHGGDRIQEDIQQRIHTGKQTRIQRDKQDHIHTRGTEYKRPDTRAYTPAYRPTYRGGRARDGGVVAAVPGPPTGPDRGCRAGRAVGCRYTERLAELAVTAGCATDPLRYCPQRPVTRAQIATFLARTTGIIEVPHPEPPVYATIAAGGFHTCAIGEAGSIDCWGNNDQNQTDPPAGIYSSIKADGFHNCRSSIQGPGHHSHQASQRRLAVRSKDNCREDHRLRQNPIQQEQ